MPSRRDVSSMAQDGGLPSGNPSAGAPRGGRISLAGPRPMDARQQNEYTETPFPGQPPLADRRPKTWRKPRQDPITDQPAIKWGAPAPPVDPPDPHGDSIICRQCQRCRCQACQSRRLFPQRWICHDKCLCSGSSVVDWCSCMCCIRGLFYHWAQDYEMDTDTSCADQPCSCAPHKRFLRWCCLGVLAIPLPCLCCYWPLHSCLDACEWCYSRYSGSRCHCPQPQTPATPEKQLLDANSDC